MTSIREIPRSAVTKTNFSRIETQINLELPLDCGRFFMQRVDLVFHLHQHFTVIVP